MSTTVNPTGGNAPGKDNSGGDGGKQPYTPWLFLRDQVGDIGDRPLPPGTHFYESPDVWCQGSKGINQPVVGEPTQVFAQVNNWKPSGLTQDSNNTTVQFFWANPTLAITLATVNPVGGTLANSQLTGQTVPAQNSVVFQCPTPWIPIEVNYGHECLFVQAFDPLFDPLVVPLQPMVDRHVGQKNEQLITLPPGMMFHFPVEARNFTREDREIAVEARRGSIPRNFAKRFGRPGMWPAELLDPVFPLSVDIDIDANAIGAQAPEAAALPPGPTLDCLGPAQVSRTQVFKAGEVRRVVISGRLPPAAAPGEIYVVRITQSIGPIIMGGYTLYVTLATGKTG
jgi:hypothetical protein